MIAKIFNAALAALGFALLVVPDVRSASTQVTIDSGSNFLYSDAGKTNLLTAGVLATQGDGAVLQLGYYTGASAGNYFSGTFVPLTGASSANSAFTNYSVGDLYANGANNGTYGMMFTFVAGSATAGNNLPATGTLLSIRFYNTTSLATATLENSVSDSTWLWQAPMDGALAPSLNFSLSDANLLWQGGAPTAFYTALPVPEPSPLIWSAAACGGLGWIVRWAKQPRGCRS